MLDLETEDPKGRVDSLVYNLAKHGIQKLEEHYGLSGVWDNLKPHVNTVVTKHVTSWEIPTELGVLLGILQANYRPKIEG